jgi:hypothetical protein
MRAVERFEDVVGDHALLGNVWLWHSSLLLKSAFWRCSLPMNYRLVVGVTDHRDRRRSRPTLLARDPG